MAGSLSSFRGWQARLPRANALQIRYFHKDHLGSIVVITNESPQVVKRDNGNTAPAVEIACIDFTQQRQVEAPTAPVVWQHQREPLTLFPA